LKTLAPSQKVVEFPLLRQKVWQYSIKNYNPAKVNNLCYPKDLNAIFGEIYKRTGNFKSLKAAENKGIFGCFSSGKSERAKLEHESVAKTI
jgi:hypothetical protein